MCIFRTLLFFNENISKLKPHNTGGSKPPPYEPRSLFRGSEEWKVKKEKHLVSTGLLSAWYRKRLYKRKIPVLFCTVILGSVRLIQLILIMPTTSTTTASTTIMSTILITAFCLICSYLKNREKPVEEGMFLFLASLEAKEPFPCLATCFAGQNGARDAKITAMANFFNFCVWLWSFIARKGSVWPLFCCVLIIFLRW